MRSNLILTGGINHDFLDTAHAIAEVLAEAQFRSTIVDDLSAGFKMLDDSDFDLVTLVALRGRMLDDDPPPAELLVRKAGDHAVTRGLEDFLVIDELYHHLWSSPNSRPLLVTESADDGSQQQIAFASEASGGRVVYSALGHDRESVTTKGHARFLQQAANWCAPP